MNEAGEYIKKFYYLKKSSANRAVNKALEQVGKEAHKKKYEDTPGHESCDMEDLDKIINSLKL